jgi:hypothetical protein
LAHFFSPFRISLIVFDWATVNRTYVPSTFLGYFCLDQMAFRRAQYKHDLHVVLFVIFCDVICRLFSFILDCSRLGSVDERVGKEDNEEMERKKKHQFGVSQAAAAAGKILLDES